MWIAGTVSAPACSSRRRRAVPGTLRSGAAPPLVVGHAVDDARGSRPWSDRNALRLGRFADTSSTGNCGRSRRDSSGRCSARRCARADARPAGGRRPPRAPSRVCLSSCGIVIFLQSARGDGASGSRKSMRFMIGTAPPTCQSTKLPMVAPASPARPCPRRRASRVPGAGRRRGRDGRLGALRALGPMSGPSRAPSGACSWRCRSCALWMRLESARRPVRRAARIARGAARRPVLHRRPVLLAPRDPRHHGRERDVPRHHGADLGRARRVAGAAARRSAGAILIGLALCLLGGVALVGESYGFAPQRLLGDLYGRRHRVLLRRSICWRCAPRAGAPWRGRVMFVSTAITAACLFVDRGRVRAAHPAAVDAAASAALLALALIVSHVGGQGLLAVALGTLPATFSSLVIFLEAVAAAAFGWILLDEPLGIVQALGGVLILFGIYVARPRNRRRAWHERRRAPARLSRTPVRRGGRGGASGACLAPHLPAPPPDGRLILLAAGKAAGSHDRQRPSGIYLDGHGFPRERLDRHSRSRATATAEPTRADPDDRGRPSDARRGRARGGRAGARARRRAPTADDLVLVLMSGGGRRTGSRRRALTLAEKQAVTRALLRSGANIGEINTVRKHLSRIKGGRLARAAASGAVVTLAISDVPGDDPAVIGSGPTVPDPSTLADARAIVARRKVPLPASRRARCSTIRRTKPRSRAIRPSSATEFRIVARPADALAAAARARSAAGYECARSSARTRRRGARGRGRACPDGARAARPPGRRGVILSGGELTVTIRGTGPRRAEPGICAGACPRARRPPGHRGARRRYRRHRRRRRLRRRPRRRVSIDATTLARARALGLDPAAFLADNNSTGFFERLGDLVTRGPTRTNVNDLPHHPRG